MTFEKGMVLAGGSAFQRQFPGRLARASLTGQDDVKFQRRTKWVVTAIQSGSMDERKPTLEYHHEIPQPPFWRLDFGGIVAMLMILVAIAVLTVCVLSKMR
jgi:hypothetical protein